MSVKIRNRASGAYGEPQLVEQSPVRLIVLVVEAAL